MEILLSNASDKPIYEQIMAQLKRQIASGELHEGQALPSIRALARDLGISVITTKRAYEELEREGFIYTVAGKGCFVAARSRAWMREDLLRRIEEHLQELSRLATAAGVNGEELCRMLRTLCEEEEI